MANSQVDALEWFQQLPVEGFAGMQDYWVKAMDAGASGPLGHDLPRMGVELDAIPAMSTEAERVFSGYVCSTNHSPSLPMLSQLTSVQRPLHDHRSALELGG
jgi:hypothetical protein